MRRPVCSTVTDSSVRARFQVSGWIQPAAASPWRLKEKLAAPLVSESNPRLQGDPQDAFICSSVYRCVCGFVVIISKSPPRIPNSDNRNLEGCTCAPTPQRRGPEWFKLLLPVSNCPPLAKILELQLTLVLESTFTLRIKSCDRSTAPLSVSSNITETLGNH